MASNQSPEPVMIDVSQLASRWKSEDERIETVAEMETQPAPSHLNPLNSSGMFLLILTDMMSVRYVGSPQHGHDVGVVQADCPAPTRRLAYYFEMTVKDAGHKGQTSIGFTTGKFKMQRHPGWEVNSCGYHGDDGEIYRGHGKGEPFGPTFTTGDTVGAGINYASAEFFFTKNGNLVGTVAKDIKGPLYPTVAVHSENEEVTVNFGANPFRFDIEKFVLQEKLKQREKIESTSLQPNISHWVVCSYLLHYGYKDTLASFDTASGSTFSSEYIAQDIDLKRDTYALDHRSILRKLIKNGDIDSTFQKLREWYPQVLQDNTSSVNFFLHSQRFIEYIRVGHLEDAIIYGRREMVKFNDVKEFKDLLQEIFGLIAYKEPATSEGGYLLGLPQREFVADVINTVVLSTNPILKNSSICMISVLERLMRQLTVCSLEKRALNGDQGEAFFLHQEIQT